MKRENSDRYRVGEFKDRKMTHNYVVPAVFKHIS